MPIERRRWREGTILSEYEWEILRMRDEEGLAWGVIAERLGTSDSAVAHTYRSAQDKLRAAEQTLKRLGRIRGITMDELETELEELRRRFKRRYG